VLTAPLRQEDWKREGVQSPKLCQHSMSMRNRPQSFANTAWAFAEMCKSVEMLPTAMAWQEDWKLERDQPPRFANMAWAFARVSTWAFASVLKSTEKLPRAMARQGDERTASSAPKALPTQHGHLQGCGLRTTSCLWQWRSRIAAHELVEPPGPCQHGMGMCKDDERRSEFSPQNPANTA